MPIARALLFFTALLFTVSSLAAGNEYSRWQINPINIKIKDHTLTLRAGFFRESDIVPFRGNIIYYQGLGDSMLNHDPLFTQLSDLGFRVISFDYMGQGGSQGTMNSTTIANIGKIGTIVFNKNRRTDCANCNEMNIIGWSTGGLAAYRQAFIDGGVRINKVVLIAPGISPNLTVGEKLSSWPLNKISMSSLTSANYEIEANPHVDPIKPMSPIAREAFLFSYNLLETACASESWIISKNIRGFVMLSDPEVDNYVNADATLKVIKRNAGHFEYAFYKGARHEIDNETAAISRKAISDIADFLISNH